MAGGDEAPPYFLCPISLQIMKDPVTLATGVTYDRSSIERWFSGRGQNCTCPVTNQLLPTPTLTPNSTLLRLIHAWAAGKTPSFSAPSRKPPVDVAAAVGDVIKMLARKPHCDHLRTMGTIKGLIEEDAENEQLKACLEESGVTSFVASLATAGPQWSSTSAISTTSSTATIINEATTLLRLMSPSAAALKRLAELKDGELIRSLSRTMQKGGYRARLDAAALLKSALRVVSDRFKAAPPVDLFDGAVDLLKDQNSNRATTMAALSILLEVAPHGTNRVRAVESGAVAVMVELLLEDASGDRRRCEAMLALLSTLCGKSEGRQALMAHPAGVAVVAGKILKTSRVATEKAVRVLLLLSRFCGGDRVVEEMMTVGAVAKLCMVVQVGCGDKARDMAKEILRLHLRAWRRFPCFPDYCLP